MKAFVRHFEVRRARAQRAFTLVELLVSMIILSMIVLGVGSSIVIALRAAEANRNPATTANQAALGQSALEQLQADLKVATAISAVGSTSCTLTVPDRDGDGKPETIIYSWAGPGSSLMRQYNSQPAVSIADNVQNFNLAYYTRTLNLQQSSTNIESAEQVLMSQNSILFSQTSLSSSAYAAEYFKPTIPSNASSWKITHVQISLHGNSASTLTLKVEAADAAGLPLLSVLGSTTLSASAVPKNSDATLDFKFATPVANLSPYQNYCIVLSSSGAGTSVNRATLTLNSNMGWTTSSNAGGTWSAISNTTAMQFTVYGTYTTTQ